MFWPCSIPRLAASFAIFENFLSSDVLTSPARDDVFSRFASFLLMSITRFEEYDLFLSRGEEDRV